MYQNNIFKTMQSLKSASAFLRKSLSANNSFNNSVHLKRLLRTSSHYHTNFKPENLLEPVSVPNHLQPHIYQSVESVLSFVKENKLSHYDTVGLLKTLRIQALMKNINIHELMSDSMFHLLCDTFVSSCHKLSAPSVVSGLRSLLQIGIPSNSYEVNTIEKVILSQIKGFSMTQLIGCLHLHSKYLHTQLQEQVAEELMNEIRSRVSEINDAAEVIMLIQVASLFEKELLKQLQEKMIEVISKMNTDDLKRIICTISESANRNKTLLSSASHFLQKSNVKPNIGDTLDILHALNFLNFYDSKLLLFLTNNRESDIRAIDQPGVISALLTVCGYLKWKHSGMLNACTQWIGDHFQACNSRDLVSLILTSAALNYVPEDVTVFMKIVSSLKFEQIGQKDVWIDFVWSCGVLNLIDKEMLLGVLSPQFHQTLLSDSSFGTVGITLKLMNLKSVLKSLDPEHVFSCNLFLESQQLPRSKEAEACHKDVLNALSNIVPMDKFMATDVCTHMGVTIDAEFIMSKKGKPLPLAQYGLKEEKPSLKSKHLPNGAQRFALMIWLFRDYTLNERGLTGINELAVRLLTAQNYVVVQVPYHVFATNKTEVKKAVYLSQLISESINETKMKK